MTDQIGEYHGNPKVLITGDLYWYGHCIANRVLLNWEKEKMKLIAVLWIVSISIMLAAIGIVAYYQHLLEEDLPTEIEDSILNESEKELLEYEIDLLKMRRETITDNTIQDHRLRDQIKELTIKLKVLEEKIDPEVEEVEQ